jgi:hypothetical protein
MTRTLLWLCLTTGTLFGTACLRHPRWDYTTAMIVGFTASLTLHWAFDRRRGYFPR